MVMATGNVCRRLSSDLTHDMSVCEETSESASALHDRLVACVRALSGPREARDGVWLEHSYARPDAAPQASRVRVLLAPRQPAPDALDVERLDPPHPYLLDDDDEEDEVEDDADEWEAEEWETRVVELAPSAVHARLARRAGETLRAMRLARLVGGASGAGKRARARAGARRLRAALAPLWAVGGSGVAPQRPAAWLHAALLAYLPRSLRRLYEEAMAEVVRAAPRLAERLLAGRSAAPLDDPLALVGPCVGPSSSPWLVWVRGASVGGEGGESRWVRRLSALVHVREVCVPAPAAAAPEAWCTGVAGAARAALLAALADAGERPVVVAGCGGGAALAVALATVARVAGLALLAAPLVTAEGSRWEALRAVRAPVLVVAGTGQATAWSGAARDVTAAPGRPARRLLEVRGADDALRLPAHHARAHRLTQHALDAAVAEEVWRWAGEVGDRAARAAGEEAEGEGEGPPAEEEHDEYAHLPHSAPTPGSTRAIEIVEGRVVSRVSGSTPLALVLPRRGASPAPGPGALHAADIMQLPIVFADDGPASDAAPEGPAQAAPGAPAAPSAADAAPPESPVTVTSGNSRGGVGVGVGVGSVVGAAAGVGAGAGPVKYTRVIVAKRGAAPRPVLLRRNLRLLPRHHQH